MIWLKSCSKYMVTSESLSWVFLGFKETMDVESLACGGHSEEYTIVIIRLCFIII